MLEAFSIKWHRILCNVTTWHHDSVTSHDVNTVWCHDGMTWYDITWHVTMVSQSPHSISYCWQAIISIKVSTGIRWWWGGGRKNDHPKKEPCRLLIKKRNICCFLDYLIAIYFQIRKTFATRKPVNCFLSDLVQLKDGFLKVNQTVKQENFKDVSNCSYRWVCEWFYFRPLIYSSLN